MEVSQKMENKTVIRYSSTFGIMSKIHMSKDYIHPHGNFTERMSLCHLRQKWVTLMEILLNEMNRAQKNKHYIVVSEEKGKN